MTCNMWQYCGYSVSAAYYVDGDRFADILVGSVPFKSTYGNQVTYLVYGQKVVASSLTLQTLNIHQGVVIKGGGVVVSGVGDINHDGYDDIMIGSNYKFNGAGFVLVTNITNVVITSDPSPAPSATPTTAFPTFPPTKSPTNSPTIAPTSALTTTSSVEPS